MNQGTNQESVVRAIIDAHQYMTLATADAHGTPWASPVWCATDDYREFFWVSSPAARHSHNLAAWERPDVQSPARHRLYHAVALHHFVLSHADQRIPVNLTGPGRPTSDASREPG
jgi:hypothetical protein